MLEHIRRLIVGHFKEGGAWNHMYLKSGNWDPKTTAYLLEYALGLANNNLAKL